MRENSKLSTKDERVLVFGIAIFLCVFLGPFDTTDDLEFWDRAVFWTISVICVGVLVEQCMLATLHSRFLTKLHVSIKLVLGGMIGAVPGTAVMIVVNMLFRPEHLDGQSFPVLWVKITIMAMLVAGLEHLIWIRFRGPNATAAQEELEALEQDAPKPYDPHPQTMSMPRLFHRLPDRLREAQIISMSMQDHYVEVTTTLGSEMLLMRLNDAVDLLDGISGARTHRSHWVARAHAIRLSKAARRYEVTLSDGRKLPVSNSYKDAVEQMLNEKGQAHARPLTHGLA